MSIFLLNGSKTKDCDIHKMKEFLYLMYYSLPDVPQSKVRNFYLAKY